MHERLTVEQMKQRLKELEEHIARAQLSAEEGSTSTEAQHRRSGEHDDEPPDDQSIAPPG